MDLKISSLMKTYDVYRSERSNKTESVSKSEKSGNKDTVAISSKAKDFQIAKNAVDATPNVRMDRVEELRSKMQNGNYDVSSSDLADKIIGNSAF